MGLLIGALVHPANVPERAGAKELLEMLKGQPRCARLEASAPMGATTARLSKSGSAPTVAGSWRS